MYTILWVDVVTTVSIIDEFESMIVVDLIVEQGTGSTLIADCEHTLLKIDDFANMVDGIATFEDISGPMNLVGVKSFNNWRIW